MIKPLSEEDCDWLDAYYKGRNQLKNYYLLRELCSVDNYNLLFLILTASID